jgi:hypothetical protein
MPKSFAQYRIEASSLNEAAKQQGRPEPIPNYATMRLKLLARAVLQARLDAGKPITQEVK